MSDVVVSESQLLREQCAADDAMCELQCALSEMEDDMLERGIVSLEQRILDRATAAQARYDLNRILPGLQPIEWGQDTTPMRDQRGGQGREHEFEPGFVRRSRFF